MWLPHHDAAHLLNAFASLEFSPRTQTLPPFTPSLISTVRFHQLAALLHVRPREPDCVNGFVPGVINEQNPQVSPMKSNQHKHESRPLEHKTDALTLKVRTENETIVNTSLVCVRSRTSNRVTKSAILQVTELEKHRNQEQREKKQKNTVVCVPGPKIRHCMHRKSHTGSHDIQTQHSSPPAPPSKKLTFS